jgi:hypothetical protein
VVLLPMPVELPVLRFLKLCCCKWTTSLLHRLSCGTANASEWSCGDATSAINLEHCCCNR